MRIDICIARSRSVAVQQLCDRKVERRSVGARYERRLGTRRFAPISPIDFKDASSSAALPKPSSRWRKEREASASIESSCPPAAASSSLGGRPACRD